MKGKLRAGRQHHGPKWACAELARTCSLGLREDFGGHVARRESEARLCRLRTLQARAVTAAFKRRQAHSLSSSSSAGGVGELGGARRSAADRGEWTGLGSPPPRFQPSPSYLSGAAFSSPGPGFCRAHRRGLRALGTLGERTCLKGLAGDVVKPAEQLPAEGLGGLRPFFCPGDCMRAPSSAGRLFCAVFFF